MIYVKRLPNKMIRNNSDNNFDYFGYYYAGIGLSGVH